MFSNNTVATLHRCFVRRAGRKNWRSGEEPPFAVCYSSDVYPFRAAGRSFRSPVCTRVLSRVENREYRVYHGHSVHKPVLLRSLRVRFTQPASQRAPTPQSIQSTLALVSSSVHSDSGDCVCLSFTLALRPDTEFDLTYVRSERPAVRVRQSGRASGRVARTELLQRAALWRAHATERASALAGEGELPNEGQLYIYLEFGVQQCRHAFASSFPLAIVPLSGLKNVLNSLFFPCSAVRSSCHAARWKTSKARRTVGRSPAATSSSDRPTDRRTDRQTDKVRA